jgi:hypothetical protein
MHKDPDGSRPAAHPVMYTCVGMAGGIAMEDTAQRADSAYVVSVDPPRVTDEKVAMPVSTSMVTILFCSTALVPVVDEAVTVQEMGGNAGPVQLPLHAGWRSDSKYSPSDHGGICCCEGVEVAGAEHAPTRNGNVMTSHVNA